MGFFCGPTPRYKLSFSVIIPTFNEENSLAAAIESCQKAGADEILVSDGGSSDNTKLVAESFSDCRFLESPQPGRGYQQAFAVSKSTSSVLIFLHADSTLDPNSINSISDHLKEEEKKPSNLCWGGFYQTIDHPSFVFRALEYGNWIRAKLFQLVYGDQGFWATRAILDLAGGFPEIPIMEDVVLSKNLRKICRPILLNPRLHTSARRWLKDGIIKRTISNWKLLWRFHNGASPEEILNSYRPNQSGNDT